MIEDKSPQNTKAWRKAHLGKPTAGDFDKIMPTKAAYERAAKGKPLDMPASREDYMFKKVVERVIGRPWDVADGQEPTIANLFAIKRGRALENSACRQLQIELRKRQIRGKLRTCGMFLTDDRTIGASPDRMLVIDGREEPCEVKSPLAHTHMEYLLSDIANPDLKYYAQIQGQMLVCNAPRAHFLSYHPRMPSKYVMFTRDEGYIGRLATQLHAFLEELKAAEEKARTLGEYQPYIEEAKE